MTTDSQPRRRLLIAGGIVLAAIVAVAVIIAVTSGGGSGSKTAGTTTGAGASGLKGVSAVSSEFAGIPQKGNVLGKPDAPATMMVFADMQCPFCAEFENGAMPTLVQRYVRSGKLKIVFQPIAIIGNDSVLGARSVASAAQQNKMFEYAAILYRNQGEENTGYLTQDYVKKIGAATPGLDVAKLTADLKAAPVNKLLNDAQAIATSGKVNSTPSFFVAKTGQTLQPLQVSALTADAFTPELDKLTG
ncbi:MAG: DsbA family protein [Thermoleophilaceae bacterium]